jgi:hypothetical protein
MSGVSLAPVPVGRVLDAVIAAAADPNVDVAKMRELLSLQKELMAMQAEQAFARAFARIPTIRVKKNGRIDLPSKKTGEIGQVPFAKWEDMMAVVGPILEAENFRLIFDSQPRTTEGGGLIVTGTLMHVDGHSKSASIPLALDTGPGRNNLQAMGSSLSYGKRYTTEMLLNIVREGDDDDVKRGGMRFITDAQVEDIDALIVETKTSLPQFLHFWGLAHLANMPEANFVPAKNMLEQRKRRQKP